MTKVGGISVTLLRVRTIFGVNNRRKNGLINELFVFFENFQANR